MISVDIEGLFKDGELHDIVKKLIIEKMDDGKKDELITESIKYLLNKKDTNSYGSPTTIQVVFERAVREIALQKSKEFIENDDELINNIESVIQDGIKRAFENKRDTIVQNIADAISNGVVKKDGW